MNGEYLPFGRVPVGRSEGKVCSLGVVLSTVLTAGRGDALDVRVWNRRGSGCNASTANVAFGPTAHLGSTAVTKV